MPNEKTWPINLEHGRLTWTADTGWQLHYVTHPDRVEHTERLDGTAETDLETLARRAGAKLYRDLGPLTGEIAVWLGERYPDAKLLGTIAVIRSSISSVMHY